MVYIYALTDPDSGNIRYIGQTNNVKLRYSAHRRGNGSNVYARDWLADLAARNQLPGMMVLQIVEDGEAAAAERWWIEDCRQAGSQLLNIAPATHVPRGEQTEVLQVRIPPTMKDALDAEVRRRKDGGDRKATITQVVLEALEAKLHGEGRGQG